MILSKKFNFTNKIFLLRTNENSEDNNYNLLKNENFRFKTSRDNLKRLLQESLKI